MGGESFTIQVAEQEVSPPKQDSNADSTKESDSKLSADMSASTTSYTLRGLAGQFCRQLHECSWLNLEP